MKGEKDIKRLFYMSLFFEIIRNVNLYMNNNYSKMSLKLNNCFLVIVDI